jgi:hypothetical protein
MSATATVAQPAARTVTFAKGGTMTHGPDAEIGVLRDSSHLADNPHELRARLAEDGYLLIRGLHDRQAVLTARREILERMGDAVDRSKPLDEGWIAPGRSGNFAGGADQAPAFHALVESPSGVMGFFDRFFGAPSTTFNFKWLRQVSTGEFTGSHYDVVYMGRGSHDLYTVWTPLGDIGLDQGPLAINVGSHRLDSFAPLRTTYGRMDVDRDHVQGWFEDDPRAITRQFGGRWATAEFRAGDALIFGMFTMHASLTNTSGCYRLTCDCRYQRQGDPIDERWIAKNGAPPIGHYAWHEPGKSVDMKDARKAWAI